jgi:hypothetical protein
MRAAPPVEFASVPGRFLRGALAVLAGATVAVPLAWGLPYFAAHRGSRQPDRFFTLLGDPLVQAGMAACVGLVAAASFWLARRAASERERTLRWDGQDWLLAGRVNGAPDERGSVSLMFDLGPWMLVRFLPHAIGGATFGAGTWLPFHLAGDLAQWASFRGALWTWRGDAPRRP